MSSFFSSTGFKGDFTFEATSPSLPDSGADVSSAAAAAMGFTAMLGSSGDQQPDRNFSPAKVEETNYDYLDYFAGDTFKDETALDWDPRNKASNLDVLCGSYSSPELTQIIFDDDPVLSDLDIRLDDDFFIEANKESALHVFGVFLFHFSVTCVANGYGAS